MLRTETNQNVEVAFGGTPNAANLAIIANNIQITYISAALRYLNKMDKDLTGTVAEHREHQGEGHSFWRAAVTAGVAENTRAYSNGLSHLATRSDADRSCCQQSSTRST